MRSQIFSNIGPDYPCYWASKKTNESLCGRSQTFTGTIQWFGGARVENRLFCWRRMTSYTDASKHQSYCAECRVQKMRTMSSCTLQSAEDAWPLNLSTVTSQAKPSMKDSSEATCGGGQTVCAPCPSKRPLSFPVPVLRCAARDCRQRQLRRYYLNRPDSDCRATRDGAAAPRQDRWHGRLCHVSGQRFRPSPCHHAWRGTCIWPR